ncbi:hypothetical protein P154DRAFT_34161 [Amniculicola lignicola CBS 123094]|uniref:Uncharacterized protein n=1 Tax=Amniculicola lignicola CBS 123094 TaxID=1392246 RepID=A0A6A5WU13_9PLEO|nr:hypothetical protein P154DRAFT_34161 [Amniculicola lignicola CBS 123094]
MRSLPSSIIQVSETHGPRCSLLTLYEEPQMFSTPAPGPAPAPALAAGPMGIMRNKRKSNPPESVGNSNQTSLDPLSSSAPSASTAPSTVTDQTPSSDKPGPPSQKPDPPKKPAFVVVPPTGSSRVPEGHWPAGCCNFWLCVCPYVRFCSGNKDPTTGWCMRCIEANNDSCSIRHAATQWCDALAVALCFVPFCTCMPAGCWPGPKWEPLKLYRKAVNYHKTRHARRAKREEGKKKKLEKKEERKRKLEAKLEEPNKLEEAKAQAIKEGRDPDTISLKDLGNWRASAKKTTLTITAPGETSGSAPRTTPSQRASPSPTIAGPSGTSGSATRTTPAPTIIGPSSGPRSVQQGSSSAPRKSRSGVVIKPNQPRPEPSPLSSHEPAVPEVSSRHVLS